ncbi:MAG TPA: transporter substrate-binding domain-containing protein [Victivallales bacterium]|nr:transporter substrate-binding domain-containing protein [Victivallales bacterium]
MRISKFFTAVFLIVLLAGCTEKPEGEVTKQTHLQMLSESYPPLVFLKDGKIEGMFAEVVDSIAKTLKINTDIIIQPWDKSYETALTTPNIVIFPIVKTSIREKRFYWIEPPLIDFTVYFYERSGRDLIINSLNEAKKYKIGTNRGFYSDEIMRREGFKNLVTYETPKDNIKALMNGEVDLVVFTDFRAEILIKKSGYSLSDILPVYEAGKGGLYIAISKGTDKRVTAEWEKAFKYLRQKRIFYKIYKKWFMGNTLYDN